MSSASASNRRIGFDRRRAGGALATVTLAGMVLAPWTRVAGVPRSGLGTADVLLSLPSGTGVTEVSVARVLGAAWYLAVLALGTVIALLLLGTGTVATRWLRLLSVGALVSIGLFLVATRLAGLPVHAAGCIVVGGALATVTCFLRTGARTPAASIGH